MAQQSSCASHFRPSWAQVVRDRHELVRHLDAQDIWPRNADQARATPCCNAFVCGFRFDYVAALPKAIRSTNIWRVQKEVSMEHTISTKDLKAKLDRNDSIKVVETLAPERYREAHLPGALNIPPDKIKELAPQVLPNKNAEIVTYCTNTH